MFFFLNQLLVLTKFPFVWLTPELRVRVFDFLPFVCWISFDGVLTGSFFLILISLEDYLNYIRFYLHFHFVVLILDQLNY
jgi:hypothetical protein